ncbi:hypothetical protein BiPBO1_76 [Brucella phage BiPBO1]|uniref:hypothetical protein n=1 Tax=Brucella phage BiPBO1 TaxID=1718278 RepID=UPI0002F65EF7|nr:hypothetical protein [Brucella inopinata]YP_009304104.1 hypothetical protein BJD47_gp76 [Brucella phage BiPBO1]ALJ98290.1 hypothetical protein BiPBO1_76 [Brucella phage BiPBO1]KEY04134.1 hypothetical protein IL59_0212055 [Brucella suis bv. 4 str. 40]
MMGHNSISDQDRRNLFFVDRHLYLKALAAKKAADAHLKNVGKQVKADLGPNGLDQIKLYEKAKTDEGLQAIKDKLEADRQALAYADIPINTQIDLFDNAVANDEKAYNLGLTAGLEGETLINPYNEATQDGQDYTRGWHEGQGILFAGIKQKEQPETESELIKGEGHTDPDFPDVEAA